MADQTDVIVSVIADYVQMDMSIDFERLSRDLPVIFRKIHQQFLEIVTSVKAMFETATYQIKNLSYDYSEVKEMLLKIMEEDQDPFTAPEDTLQFKTSFWSNMFQYASDYAPETYRGICDYITSMKQRIKQAILEDLTKQNGGKRDEKNPLRQFLFSRMRSLGFYKGQAKLGLLDAITMSMAECWIPYDQKEHVRNRFRDIIENAKEIRVSINTVGESDPFVMALQEMLTRGQIGRINDGMVVEDFAGAQDLSPSDIPQLLNRNLVKIKEYLDNRSFLRVQNLKINSRYADEQSIETLLQEVHLANGSPLAAKVTRFELHPFEECKILELFLPTEWGYWCWNTVQAISRINQEFRQDKQDKEWILDKQVLEKIIQGYLNAV